MIGVLPRVRHLGGAGVRVAAAAHSLDDPLREEHPGLLVVLELGMALERLERVPASILVAGRVEVEPVALAEPPVPVWAEVRARLGQREVDVEHTARSTPRR